MQAMETAEFVAHFRHRFPHCVGRPLLVALSGGRDSVALLHLLGDQALRLQLSAVHVHHGLRGAEADADAEFCRRLCAALAIPIEVVHLPDDDERPVTGEAAWRRRRYRALFRHAAVHGIETIATGHHRDDVAEGVLVQILRGAGPRALAGIASETTDGVIRPLLPWGRNEINGWLEEHRIEWRDDASNLDTDRLRNRVRHEVLPALESEDPQLRTHLVNLAAAIADGEDFMAAELARRAPFIDPWDPEGGVAAGILVELPRALRARWLHGQMVRLGVDRVTRRQLELFHDCLDLGTPRSVTMGGRWRLRIVRGRLWAEPPSDPAGAETTLEPGSATLMGPPGWLVRLSTDEDLDPGARWRWRPHSADAPIRLRPAHPGDRLVVASGATRQAQKLLAERLPRHLRSAWPLFCENDMICWIPGVWQHPDPGESSNRVVEVIRQ
jgi:tRNA(Ile)-lysidine synthase